MYEYRPLWCQSHTHRVRISLVYQIDVTSMTSVLDRHAVHGVYMVCI